ncbi:hypothetical protein JTE90_003503 [Oedothorax gibbosus]|uniref:Uncharacterized protein n=1 Tax=Oedothorax gibbosus TaxID=931172 RepID=A0AAV6TE95_9ARAC|nr:hypothetical protein JTE90_012989 [Oedothorax gibbosus]KAG8172030.1 hypothetical protein JTE90_003503 [Oedothorax gibbosus]
MFLRFRKKPFHHRGTPTIKGPLYLILPQKYCHKIKYETSHSRQTVLDSPRPALHIAAGRGNNKGRKGRQASRVGHAHGIQLTPPAARCYDHNMHHIPTEIISAMERHGTGAGPLAEKLRREGSRPD